jgi:nitrite reductase/ring-hydroxylating ferredoxin subunit
LKFWKKHHWHCIAATEAEIKLGENGIGVIEVAGKKICLTKQAAGWVAFNNQCPHAGFPMVEGYTDSSGNVVCPMHQYKFSLKNGRSKIPEGFCLKMYPIETREDGLYIGL